MTTYIGIDVSKQTFHAFINRKARRFDNATSGFACLLELLPPDAYCVMEATGNYGYALAEYLVSAGIRVAIVNPFQIKRFAQMILCRQKTDSADAKLITAFADNQ